MKDIHQLSPITFKKIVLHSEIEVGSKGGGGGLVISIIAGFLKATRPVGVNFLTMVENCFLYSYIS
jgi:hypothetical protein